MILTNESKVSSSDLDKTPKSIMAGSGFYHDMRQGGVLDQISVVTMEMLKKHTNFTNYSEE